MINLGQIGEDIASEFLVQRGFSIIDRNYRKKWGEIDIVAKKSGALRFIEVKAVSCENIEDVTREIDRYQPEENVHPMKLKRLARTIQTYLLGRADSCEWQFDVLAVFVNLKDKKSYVRFTENVVL